MHPETLFSASGKLAMAGWALLVFAPRWRWSQRIASVIIPLTLAIVYVVLIVLHFAKSPGGFGSLGQARSRKREILMAYPAATVRIEKTDESGRAKSSWHATFTEPNPRSRLTAPRLPYTLAPLHLQHRECTPRTFPRANQVRCG